MIQIRIKAWIGRMRVLRVCGVLLCAMAASSTAEAGVLIVSGGGGGGAYGEIQQAVSAALDGDTILVKSGYYAPFTVDGKALTVVADTGATVLVAGSVRVMNVSAGKHVMLIGLQITAASVPHNSPPDQGSGIHVFHNQGAVRVERCAIVGADAEHLGPIGAPLPDGRVGAYVANNANVAFVACSLTGGTGDCPSIGAPGNGTDGGRGGDGAHCENSLLAFYDCVVRGGTGGCGDSGGNGGRGAFVPNYGLFCSGSQFRGGDGGQGEDYVALTHGGNGGDGIEVQAAQLQLLDSSPIGGQGGTHCCGFPGTAGLPVSGPGHVHTYSGTRCVLTAPNPVREATQVPISVSGAPGEQAYLYISGASGFQFRPDWKGIWFTTTPYVRRILLGTIPTSGILATQLSVPDMGAGFSATTWFIQALRVDSSGAVTLGSLVSLSILDSIY